MRKLLFLFAFILVSCDMSEENVVEQEEQNLYTLIVHNTNAYVLVTIVPRHLLHKKYNTGYSNHFL